VNILKQLHKKIRKGAKSQKVTTDAFHLNPAMSSMIERGKGIFIIGLKENQKELLADIKWHIKNHKPLAIHSTLDKGYGRLEHRHYFYFEVKKEYFDKR